MKTNSSGSSGRGARSINPRNTTSPAATRRAFLKPKSNAKRRLPIALIEEHFSVTERPVTFALFNPDAREVFVAGTFNNWDPQRTPLQKNVNARWEVEVRLKPGTYEYRLVVDGVWQEDPMAPRFTSNPYGGLNSVIIIKE